MAGGASDPGGARHGGCEKTEAIARRLYLSPKTIRNHASNIFMKLHVADRAEAIVRARRAGLRDPPASP